MQTICSAASCAGGRDRDAGPADPARQWLSAACTANSDFLECVCARVRVCLCVCGHGLCYKVFLAPGCFREGPGLLKKIQLKGPRAL